MPLRRFFIAHGLIFGNFFSCARSTPFRAQHTIDPTGTVTIDPAELGTRSGPAAKGTIKGIGPGEVSEVAAFFSGGYAGLMSIIDAIPFVDNTAAKEEAFRDAGLEGTWVVEATDWFAQTGVYAGIGAAAGAALGALPLAKVIGTKGVAFLGGFGTGLATVHGLYNINEAYQDYKEGSNWRAAGHLFHAGLDGLFAVVGVRSAFPKTRVPVHTEPVAPKGTQAAFEAAQRAWKNLPPSVRSKMHGINYGTRPLSDFKELPAAQRQAILEYYRITGANASKANAEAVRQLNQHRLDYLNGIRHDPPGGIGNFPKLGGDS